MSTPSSSIVSRLKFRHLRFMLALAETGSLARTAERLSVSYPAVVKTRLEIEETLGARLLAGRGDAAVFTEIGTCLVQASRRILAELDCAGEEIAALRDGLHGHLVVGVRSPDALQWLTPAIVQFRTHFPGVSVSLVDGLHESIACGEVDIGFARAGPMHGPQDLAFQPLFTIRSAVVGSGSHALPPRARPNWPTLLALPWVLPPTGTPLRDRFDEFLAMRGLQGPANSIAISDASAQMEMFRAGSFLGLSSESVAQHLVERRIASIVVAKLTALDDHVAMIWRNHVPLHPVLLQFKQFVLAYQQQARSAPGLARATGLP
ncbi:LysR family transcriptional regulator [Bordetella sp. BOR01]|uniref:LysR family transcriptional regulator n=1 Tax=Bordetella sp. BOR01 TaxID=2854779 RepID=UPI001C48217F|nr:LysR family transcriptional regulator [Bordetella sp. BOR01]MBV7483694.1 LysR family transcriptional regulator [Bordetella sp. BOR01]